MKRYNFLLSVIMVPAMVMQGGDTCSGGGGGSTPPTVTLPGSLQGVQTYNFKTGTLYDFAVSSVSSAGVFSVGTTYAAWCTSPSGLVPGGGINPDGTVTPPEDPNNKTGVATYTPVNSYSISGTGDINHGVPGFTYDAPSHSFTTTLLTLEQEWSAVNWVINHPTGISGEATTSTDTQAAIWQLLHPEAGFGFVVTSPLTPTSALTGNSWLLYKDALQNGLAFIPASGQLVGILLVPTTPAGSRTYQGVLIGVPIACTTGTGSATLTKTVNVGAAGANAFQLVTYTYTVRNTGSTTLQNLVVVDDNGTPNYREDDVTINFPSGFTLAPGAAYSLTSTAYLPISLFYQSGAEAAFDTLIPQIVPVPAGSPAGTLPSLLLTYLIDSDVTDNTYGSGASAGWAGNGGHTFAEELGGYAEFAFFNAKGALISDFNVNYLQNVGKGGKFPSGYSATQGKVLVGGSNFISQLSSTLQDNLNDYANFNDATVNSPAAGTPNWQTLSAYKVLVNEGLFGMYGMGSAEVKLNSLAATETGYSGKCGYSRSATYKPRICGNLVNSTAWLCAQVCGCSTVVKAKACLTVKLCGAPLPKCNNPGAHRCQDPVNCSCGCGKCLAGNHGHCTNTVKIGCESYSAKCKAPVCGCRCPQCEDGNHGSCSRVGCTDATCHANHCGHNTIQYIADSKTNTVCW